MSTQTKNKIFISGLILLFTFHFSLLTCAQSTNTAKKKWQYIVEPYLMFASMKGTTGLGTLPNVEVDASASDIFSNLKFGAMLYTEAYNGVWAISSDIIYMHLGQDAVAKNAILGGEVDAKQFAWELAGLRTVLSWLDVGIGARLNSMKMGMDLQVTAPGGSTMRSRSSTETWVDPIIISRVRFPFKGKWMASFRGDIGGFGIGSDLAWQIQAYAGYRFSHLFQLTGGYRVISVDYEKGSGEGRFLYDVNSFGPVIRFGFNF